MQLRFTLTTVAASLLAISGADAQQRSPDDPWWFEVEAIVFERNVSANEIDEQFPLEVTPIPTQEIPDFISATLFPDFRLLRNSAPECLAEEVIELPLQFTAPLDINQELLHAPLLTVPSANQKIFFEKDNVFLHQVVAEQQLQNVDYVLSNSPADSMSESLNIVFADLNTDYSMWLESTRQRALVPRFEMFTPVYSAVLASVAVPETLYCQWTEELEYFPSEYQTILQEHWTLDAVPRTIHGIEYPFSDVAYTLPREDLRLNKLKRDIQRTRGLNVILHTAWRQNVAIGREQAPWYRLFAGRNLKEAFNYAGLPLLKDSTSDDLELSEQPEIFDQIQEILEQESSDDSMDNISRLTEKYIQLKNSPLNSEFEELWTLDGRMKIFIEYIGGTPYLHIDSDLNYRKPKFVDWEAMTTNTTQTSMTNGLSEGEGNGERQTNLKPDDNFLQSYHFDQIRRVISNEIHYFDHPMFGMVFQIRRYKRPDPDLPPDYYD